MAKRHRQVSQCFLHAYPRGRGSASWHQSYGCSVPNDFYYYVAVYPLFRHRLECPPHFLKLLDSQLEAIAPSVRHLTLSDGQHFSAVQSNKSLLPLTGLMAIESLCGKFGRLVDAAIARPI